MSVAVTGERTQSETLSSAIARPCWEACQGGLYLKCNAVYEIARESNLYATLSYDAGAN